jgi:hypothetical protein
VDHVGKYNIVQQPKLDEPNEGRLLMGFQVHLHVEHLLDGCPTFLSTCHEIEICRSPLLLEWWLAVFGHSGKQVGMSSNKQ